MCLAEIIEYTAVRNKRNSKKSKSLFTKKYDHKITAFWDTAPCGLVEVDRRFGGAYSLYHQGRIKVYEVDRKGKMYLKGGKYIQFYCEYLN
jgi:hypothetical protein